ncbi:hypothetical protein BDZ45DRAFT_366384 [Acephala macrosclerotiorum]|nr:hypothetical protein BDZ45DRAFT_366384 [Acephala macrosclerotiorum]
MARTTSRPLIAAWSSLIHLDLLVHNLSLNSQELPSGLVVRTAPFSMYMRLQTELTCLSWQLFTEVVTGKAMPCRICPLSSTLMKINWLLSPFNTEHIFL